MAKTKSGFCCSSCGYETSKWQGKCPSCLEWNTLQIFQIGRKKLAPASSPNLIKPSRENINDINSSILSRSYVNISEWDRVLGGSVDGQAILISGEPGIGKSTLLLQIAEKLSLYGDVTYINGEESSSQVKLRADRLKIQSENLYLFSDTDIENIVDTISASPPKFLIVDSLQTLFSPNIESSPGSLPQLRECTHRIVNLCKSMNITCLLVSHITKDGFIAGPKAIEHLVDTVLFLETDARKTYRVLRAFKNRFGSTDEAGFFEMHESGMIPAENLSAAFLSVHEDPVFGSATYAHSEGQRVFPIEIQVLCHASSQNYTKRTAEGIDNNRIALLCAVIEKQLKIPLSRFDVYANITGGLSIEDRALDLPLVAALCSSFKEIPVSEENIFIGEIGLSGEIRPVRDLKKRVRESVNLGVKNIYIPFSKKEMSELKDAPIKPIKHIRELFYILFSK